MIAGVLNDIISELVVWLSHSSLSGKKMRNRKMVRYGKNVGLDLCSSTVLYCHGVLTGRTDVGYFRQSWKKKGHAALFT